MFKQERWGWKYKSQERFGQGLSKHSFLVHTGACRKEKAGIRSKRSSRKSLGARKEIWQCDKLKEIDHDLAMIKSGIEIAENSIKYGNSDLESLLTKEHSQKVCEFFILKNVQF